MRKQTLLLSIFAAVFAALWAQQPDVRIVIRNPNPPKIALPDIRGTGDAQPLMATFNKTLTGDIEESGAVDIASRSLFPLEVPQQLSDFRPPLPETPPRRQGPWLTDWSAPPLNANFLAIGYTAVQNGRLALIAAFLNVNQSDLSNATIFQKRYFATVDDAGARLVAHQFAADILAHFQYTSLFGSKIYFTSNRTGAKEIWVMENDGANQRQVTKLNSLATFVGVSPDGSRIGFSIIAPPSPHIMMMSTDTGRRLPFINSRASMNSSPNFTPDGKRVVFSSTAAGGAAQIYICNADGSNINRLTFGNSVDSEPKVNPKTGSEILFISGRSGPAQLYKMSIDGSNPVRLTSGEGDVANPAWSPDGQFITFCWTRGFAPGNYNIFIMDAASGKYSQLTHGAGVNENPVFAPDGRHLVFASNRHGSLQIYTMLADGNNVRQLTTQGRNEKPVWSK